MRLVSPTLQAVPVGVCWVAGEGGDDVGEGLWLVDGNQAVRLSVSLLQQAASCSAGGT
jgi:hypothetical protein